MSEDNQRPRGSLELVLSTRPNMAGAVSPARGSTPVEGRREEYAGSCGHVGESCIQMAEISLSISRPFRIVPVVGNAFRQHSVRHSLRSPLGYSVSLLFPSALGPLACPRRKQRNVGCDQRIHRSPAIQLLPGSTHAEQKYPRQGHTAKGKLYSLT